MNQKAEILEQVLHLRQMYELGLLGGEIMPEDENPHLDKSSKENYLYFTLPMALNYQRNSYILWQCANRMHADEMSRWVFDSKKVCSMSEDELRYHLVKFKVALQPNKQPIIWKRLCQTIETKLDGDLRNLFLWNHYSVYEVKSYIQKNKKDFPYLGGNKICNYWLYVLEQYSDLRFIDRDQITVAPDTHVIQASQKLGIISEEEAVSSNVQLLLAERWKELLNDSELVPIDLHTPLWLWSRGKFSVEL